MAQGSKKKYTSKQKRKASKIEKGYKKRGVSSKEAERRAWATVNKSVVTISLAKAARHSLFCPPRAG
jgi:hypothetical protein